MASASAARVPFHFVSPKPAGVPAMLEDLSTTSSTFTGVGLASRFVAPQMSAPAPLAPPSESTKIPSEPAPAPFEPLPAVDDSPPLPFGPLSIKDSSFDPQAAAHRHALSAVNAVK